VLLGATSTDLAPTVVVIVIVSTILLLLLLLLLILHAREVVSVTAFLLGGRGGLGAPPRDKVTRALDDTRHVFHRIGRGRGQARKRPELGDFLHALWGDDEASMRGILEGLPPVWVGLFLLAIDHEGENFPKQPHHRGDQHGHEDEEHLGLD
jgi:hypothetical protein